MQCPYCGNEMKAGSLHGDGRSKVRWKEGAGLSTVSERISGSGELSATQYTFWRRFRIESHYCPLCKKIIIDTEVKK